MSAAIGIVLIVGLFFFIDWLRSRNRRRREKQLGSEFKATYEKFASEHGDLYEKLSVPMDDADRHAVNKYHNVVIIIVFPFAAGFFALLYFNFPADWEDSIAAFFFGLIVAVAIVWSFHTRKKLLANNEKVIVKGVITYKRITNEDDSKTYYITISGKDSIAVSRADYNKFNHGDIVKLEALGTLAAPVKLTISSLGKLEAK